MNKLFVLIVMIFTIPAWATITSGAQNCPNQFEGKVKEVFEPIGASTFFSVNKVVFENERTLRGEASETVTIDVLQNGPFKMELGKEYRVHIRDDRLCWIEEI